MSGKANGNMGCDACHRLLVQDLLACQSIAKELELSHAAYLIDLVLIETGLNWKDMELDELVDSQAFIATLDDETRAAACRDG